MTPTVPHDPNLVVFYENAEQEYLRLLPPEHFMEATDHARQREITLESFAVIREARPDIQCFNELLVQAPRRGRKKLTQVVPDNFVVVHSEPIQAVGSFNIPLQPVRPLLVLEYVSKHNRRKDYDENFDKYEGELKVPYYLLFYPDGEELSLFKLTDAKYTSVLLNASGRLAIPELELEAALLQGWVRFWFRGELVPLPGDLLRQRNAVQSELTATKTELTTTKSELNAERQAREAVELELARLRAELARAKQGP